MKVGVYADIENLRRTGGYAMRYDVLLAFACRDGAELVRANAYLAYDSERSRSDEAYRAKAESFHAALRDLGYKVMLKEVRWYGDESGRRVSKANSDLDLAVDLLLESDHLDRVLLASGDGDFSRAVRAVQNRGCRVEVVGLDHPSIDLRQEADFFLSGYAIPGLVQVEAEEEAPAWGEAGSRVRGWCYWKNGSYGYFRFLTRIAPLRTLNSHEPGSPFDSAFFHVSQLPSQIEPAALPSRNLVFEFDLEKNERGLTARNIQIVGV